MFERCGTGEHIAVEQVGNTASAIPLEASEAHGLLGKYTNTLFSLPWAGDSGCSLPASDSGQGGENLQ